MVLTSCSGSRQSAPLLNQFICGVSAFGGLELVNRNLCLQQAVDGMQKPG